jgi:predicted phosphodiesterase
MRTLIILRGPRKSGKTRFVNENNLTTWHIDQTSIEQAFTAPEMTEGGNIRLSPKGVHKAHSHFFSALGGKLENSEFIICEMTDKGLPAPNHKTNFTDKTITDICEAAKTFRYQIFVVDFTHDFITQSEDFLYGTQDTAGYYKHTPWKNQDQQISPKQMAQKLPYLRNPVVDLSHLDALVAIGDIHANYTPLHKCLSFAKGRKNVGVIFTGDFISKGPDPAKTLRLLDRFASDETNVFMLSGNHEIGLEGWAWSRRNVCDRFSKFSLPLLMSENYKRHEARSFLSRIQDHCRIHWRGHDILATHGGLSAPTGIPGLLPGTLKRMGVGPSSLDIDRLWEKNTNNSKQFQIHGHRNHQDLKIPQCRTSFNLEGIDSHSAIHGMVLKSNNFQVEVKGFCLPIKNPSS